MAALVTAVTSGPPGGEIQDPYNPYPHWFETIQDARWAGVAPWALVGADATAGHPLWRTWIRAARTVESRAQMALRDEGQTVGQRAGLPAPPQSAIRGKRMPGGKRFKRPPGWGEPGHDPYSQG